MSYPAEAAVETEGPPCSKRSPGARALGLPDPETNAWRPALWPVQ